MDFRKVFAIGLAARLGAVLLALMGLVAAIELRPPGALWIVTGSLCAMALFALWAHVDKTNREVARFIEAVNFSDLAVSFSTQHGSGFDALAGAMNTAIQRLRTERQTLTDDNSFFEAVLDNVPVAILTVDQASKVSLVNRSARKLFVSAHGAQPSDFAGFGGAFLAALTGARPPERQIVQLLLPTGSQRTMVQVSTIQRLAGSFRLIAVQPIQDALNAVELAAQSDLVRVLTHEIMNSITPVTSLAQSVAELIANADRGDDPRMADARLASEALARRADGVMNFVQSYRQISRPPTIRRQTISAQAFVDQISALFRSDWPSDRAELALTVAPSDLSINADPDLLAQVVINLMRNGAEASEGADLPIAVGLDIAGSSGTGTTITVTDAGPGIPEAIQNDVFLPFFTTKSNGSGIGLSFAKQVVHAHEGAINISSRENGGTAITIRI